VTPEEFQLGNLEIVTFELGLAITNTYLLGDPETKSAIVIDPAWDGEQIASVALDRGWQINAIWLTHAHFDHFGGVRGIVKSTDTPIPVALHPLDLPLWQTHGGAGFFGITEFDPGPEPTIDLEAGMELTLGKTRFEVRHTPGHSLGHVIFYQQQPLALGVLLELSGLEPEKLLGDSRNRIGGGKEGGCPCQQQCSNDQGKDNQDDFYPNAHDTYFIGRFS